MQSGPFARLAFPFAAPIAAVAALALGCSEEESGLTYQKDISTMFAECTLCHQQGAPFGPGKDQGPDMVDLFSEPNGLLVSPAQWKQNHPEYSIPARDVAPGQPDDSFLINKIADQLPPNEAGVAMPYQIEPITPEELASMEQWVSDGAKDDEFFRTEVYNKIFINPLRNPKGEYYYPGKCNGCHYSYVDEAGVRHTPTPPDIEDPFGPDGLVGVASIFRDDLQRVAPGNLEGSLLIWRVRESAGLHLPPGFPVNLPTSEYGAPMPKPTPLLGDAQVQLVRQWILEGARP